MKRFILILVSFLACILPVQSQIVDSVDTPYTKDEHTRLLLHFDGSMNAGFDINTQGNYEYIDAEGGQRPNSFNEALVLDNDSPEDSSFVQIQDKSTLDLTGSWTIEMWFAAIGFSCQDTCAYSNSVLWAKSETDTNQPNYKTYIRRAGDRAIVMEYSVKGKDKPKKFVSDSDLLVMGDWQHVAVVRNIIKNTLTLYVHRINDDDEVNLMHKQQWQIQGDSLMTNDGPLQLAGGKLSHPDGPFHDGYIEEFRISDTVRTYARSTDIADPVGSVPDKFRLKQNYPNPFNPSTNIRFTLPQSEQVRINVYNTIGQKIETLVNRPMTAGSHSVTFNGEGLPSGVYIYRLKAGEYRESRKMLLVK